MTTTLSDYGYNILMIETNKECNMRCKYCAYRITADYNTTLPSEQVYQIIDSVNPDDKKFDAVFLQKYNEPLTDPRIYKFILYAKGRGLRTQIITNGYQLILADTRKALLAVEPSRILISFQILDKQKFNETKGTPIMIEKYKEGIFQFLTESVERNCTSEITIDVACNFLSEDYWSKNGRILHALGMPAGDPSVPDTVHEVRDNVVKFIEEIHRFNPAFRYDEFTTNHFLNTVTTDYNSQQGYRISDHITLKLKQFIHGLKLTAYKPAMYPVPCKSTMLSVDARGDVMPCCLSHPDIVIGNINDRPLEEILRDPMNIGTPDACRRCQGAPTWRGVAVAGLYRKIKETRT